MSNSPEIHIAFKNRVSIAEILGMKGKNREHDAFKPNSSIGRSYSGVVQNNLYQQVFN